MVEITPEYLGGHPIIEAEYWHTAAPFESNLRVVMHSDRFNERIVGITYISDDVANDPIVIRKMFLDHLAEAEQKRAAKEKRA